MTELETIALMTAVPATIAAIGTIMANRRIREVHTIVNGGLNALKKELADTKAALQKARKIIHDSESQ